MQNNLSVWQAQWQQDLYAQSLLNDEQPSSQEIQKNED